MAEMRQDPNPYTVQYLGARALCEDNLPGCISAARRNLADPALPPYHIIKNCILVACALDNWRDADVFRLRAEDVYHQTLSRATSEHDDKSLELLKSLTKDLKTLNQWKDEEMLERVSVGLDEAQESVETMDDGTDVVLHDDYSDVSNDDGEGIVYPDDYSDVSKDDVQLATGDGAAKDVEFPVRTKEGPAEAAEAAERVSPVNTNTLAPPPVTANMLRRKKSSYDKSGAYHAHEFNNSISKAGPSPKGLREMFEQEQDGRDSK
ncbi:hypothetical protein N0V94_003768 [Neodidymelliopsis sp. IMI 364377]|nr:hypothetical protein N0V94_003768 [Neodidymelliopsis sp. IMI 364377]